MSDAVLDIESLGGLDNSATETTETVETPEVNESEIESGESNQSEGDSSVQSEGKITGKAIRDAVKAASEQFPNKQSYSSSLQIVISVLSQLINRHSAHHRKPHKLSS